jgi:hypothetical protein
MLSSDFAADVFENVFYTEFVDVMECYYSPIRQTSESLEIASKHQCLILQKSLKWPIFCHIIPIFSSA